MAKRVEIVSYGHNVPNKIISSQRFKSLPREAKLLYMLAWSWAVEFAGDVYGAYRNRGTATAEDYDLLYGSFVYIPECITEYMDITNEELQELYNALSKNGFFRKIKAEAFDISRLDSFGIIDYTENTSIVCLSYFLTEHLYSKEKKPAPQPGTLKGNTATATPKAKKLKALEQEPKKQEAETVKRNDIPANVTPVFNGDHEADKPHSPGKFTGFNKELQEYRETGYVGPQVAKALNKNPTIEFAWQAKPGDPIDKAFMRHVSVLPAVVADKPEAIEFNKEIQASEGKTLTEEHCNTLKELAKYKQDRKTKELNPKTLSL